MKIGLLFLWVLIFLSGCGLGPDLSKDRVPRSPSPTPFIPEKSIDEYMREGSAAYLARDYRAAITPYKRALEIEQRDPKLDKKHWYVLVDNLAMSYGLTVMSKTLGSFSHTGSRRIITIPCSTTSLRARTARKEMKAILCTI